MPTSDPRVITAAAAAIIAINPESVLDVGVGIGKWGLLTREYTDIWHHKRFYPRDWKTRLLGVEIHEDYRNPVWSIYDAVLVGNALECLDDVFIKNGRFDLCVMIDVLEHFSKENGITVVRKILDNCDHLLLSYSNCPQKDVCQNKNEDHISKWSFSDFPPHATRLLSGDNEDWALFLLTSPS